jgi:hypothetical protein
MCSACDLFLFPLLLFENMEWLATGLLSLSYYLIYLQIIQLEFSHYDSHLKLSLLRILPCPWLLPPTWITSTNFLIELMIWSMNLFWRTYALPSRFGLLPCWSHEYFILNSFLVLSRIYLCNCRSLSHLLIWDEDWRHCPWLSSPMEK